VVFLGVGFETTAPTVAAVLLEAARDTRNLSVLVAHKLVPPALAALGQRADFAIDGFLLPGHVSTIIGSEAYQPVLAKAGLPGVVAGFEPLDVLLAIWMLLDQIAEGRVGVEVEYRGAVRPGGNRRALEIMEQVFDPVDADWRGLGRIPGSGLALKAAFAHLDAAQRFELDLEPSREPDGCCCDQVLVGALAPPGCPLFATVCTPADPVGPCMVSSEGSCAAHYHAGPCGPGEEGRAG
jgi:hydrogenase expression/formation protein HypD